MNPRNECPSQSELSAFLLGEIPDEKLDEIADHLEHCPVCESSAQELDKMSDTAIAALRWRSTDAPAVRRDSDSTPHSTPNGMERDSEAMSLPDFIGEYKILAELGRGGMGVVYMARHPKLRRIVALKMLLGGLFADPLYRRRFRSEAEAIARMQHPNIVQIFEIGEHHGQPYFTLEHVDGGSLQNALDKPQPPRQAAEQMEILARAVHYAHEHAIVHRDLKPANILLTKGGQPKITDFGVAKLLEGSDAQTVSGLVIGTPEYMAPEQADARRTVGPPADIYALGSLLYKLLTGRPPFQSASALETLEQVKSHEPVPLRRLQPHLPRDLEIICLKCLQKEPQRRYANAAELADDLGRFLQGQPIRARPVGMVTRLRRWRRRNPMVASLTGVIAVLLVLLSIGAVLGMKQAVERAEAEVQARVKLEYQLYLTNIALAERECAANNMRRVTQILDACPKELRGWEWHYLKRRLHQEDLILRCKPGVWMQGMTFSPNGGSLAATDRDGIISIWNLENPKEPRTLPKAVKRNVSDMAVSPDGKMFALASGGKSVVLLDADLGKRVRTFRGHTNAVLRVAFSPDGSNVVSTSWDNTSKIWDLTTGRSRTLGGHSDAVTGVSISPDGKYIATASNDRTVNGWGFDTGKATLTLKGHTSFVRAVSFSHDGRRIASAGTDETIRIWHAETGASISVLRGHIGDVSALAFDAKGHRLASGGRDRTIKLWDVETGEEMITLHGHLDTVTNVSFSPDGNQLASTSWDKTVRVWDATPLRGNPVHETMTIHAHSDSVQSVVFSPDNRYIASASLDSTVKLWNVASGKLVRIVADQKGQVWSLAISPDGERLAYIGGDATPKFFDLSTGEMTQLSPPHPRWGTSVVFSRDRKYVASAGRDGTVKIWNNSNDELIRSFKAKTIWVNGLAFSPDGQWLATANDDATVELWAVATGQKVRELHGHQLTVTGVAFRHDGKRLASSSRDGTVKIWNPQTGELVRTLIGHTDRVYSVAYSPHGKLVASTGADETVRLWNATTGEEIRLLRGHTNIVTCIVFSLDGRWLATGSRDKTIKTWRVPRLALNAEHE